MRIGENALLSIAIYVASRVWSRLILVERLRLRGLASRYSAWGGREVGGEGAGERERERETFRKRGKRERETFRKRGKRCRETLRRRVSGGERERETLPSPYLGSYPWWHGMD